VGILVAISIAVILSLIILKKPYIGLLVIIVNEYTRIGMLFPDFGAIHFQALLIGVTSIRFIHGLSFSKDITIPHYPQNKAQIGFFCVMLLNVVFAFVKTPAAKVLYGQAGIILLFFMIIGLLDTQEKLSKFIFYFILANTFLALLGLNNYFIEGIDIDNLSTGGFVGGADDFAVVISSAIPFTFFLYQQQKMSKAKIFYALLTVLFVTAVILAFSRGGWVTLICMSFLIILFSTHKMKTVTLLIIAVIVLLNILPPQFADEFQTISAETGTGKHRIELWSAGFHMFLDHPILGVGMMNFPGVYGRFYMPENPSNPRWITVHSIYFQLIAEMGILGAIFFILIAYWIIKDNWIVQRKMRAAAQVQSFSYAISQGLTVSILGYLIGGAFLSLLYYPPLYIIAALTVALRNIVEKEVLKKDYL
jgi:putative inorganic carbon (hco3(-)) transporter